VRIDNDGIAIELDVHGDDDAPAVLLLHGFPDERSLWRHQVPALTQRGFRVVVPDQRGFGASDKPTDVGAYAMGFLVGDMLAVLDHLDIDRAHVVGHDWGAAVAWVLATLAPDRVDHLVALSVGHPASFAAAGYEQREKSWYMLLFQFPGIAEQWLSADDFRNLRQWSQHPDADAVTDRLKEDGALTAGLGWYRANLPPETLLSGPPDLPPVTAPTMGIWSDGDMALTEASMTGSAAHVTGPWRYERIDGVGHWIPLEAPDRLNRVLVDFLPAPGYSHSR
jgi:pimeloyl-ACP methyl ester carboxylesterase